MNHEPMADTRDMYMAHTMFRREIGLAAGLVAGVERGDGDRAQIIADHISFVDDILRRHHHGEDEHLWPRLLDRARDEAADVIVAMDSQHAEIEKAVTAVRTRTEVWRDSAAREGGPEAVAALMDLSSLLNEHFAAEEEQGLPLVERHITAVEWGRMIAEDGSTLTPDQAALVFGMMSYEADPAVVRDIVATLPPELGPAMAGQAAEAFARHAEKVYGTPIPPRLGAQR